MPHISELSTILRAKDDEAPEPGAQVIYIRNGKQVTGFGAVLPGARAFVVQTDHPSPWLSRRSLEIVDPETLERDTLEYTIEITIPNTSAGLAVARLSLWDDPATAIHEHAKQSIERWFKAACADRAGTTIRGRLASSCREIEQRVERDLATSFHVKAAFRIPLVRDTLTDINLSITPVQGTLHDFRSRPVPLGVNLTLERHGAMPLQEPLGEVAWADKIREILYTVAPRDITAAIYYLDRDALRNLLIREIDQHVAAFGRKVHSLDVHGVEPLSFRTSGAVSVEHVWSGPSGRAVTFLVTADMSLGDTGLTNFLNHHKSLEVWLSKSVEAELPRLLVGKDFVDLDQDAVQIVEDQLHQSLLQLGKADDIKIATFVAEPDVPRIIIHPHMTFTVPSDPPYTTQNVERPLKMEIHITGEFSSPPPARLLHPNDIVQSELVKCVRDEVQRTVARKQPEAYYAGSKEREELDEILSKAICKVLKAKFNFSCKTDDVAFIYSDEDLQDLGKTIMGQSPIEITCDVNPRGSASPLRSIRVTVIYQTHLIELKNLAFVLPKRFSPETFRVELSKALEMWTKEVLNALPQGAMGVTNGAALRRILSDAVSERAKEAFATAVSATAIEVKPSEAEKIDAEEYDLPYLVRRYDLDAVKEVLKTAGPNQANRLRALLTLEEHLLRRLGEVQSDFQERKAIEHVKQQLDETRREIAKQESSGRNLPPPPNDESTLAPALPAPDAGQPAAPRPGPGGDDA